jgi:hypothetical protein
VVVCLTPVIDLQIEPDGFLNVRAEILAGRLSVSVNGKGNKKTVHFKGLSSTSQCKLLHNNFHYRLLSISVNGYLW